MKSSPGVLLLAGFVTVGSVLFGGCVLPGGKTVDEKRTYAQNMRDEALNELYTARPEAKAKIEKAAGYGVFSNVGSKIFALSTGNGYGVVRDKGTGRDSYMKMLEVGGGIGLGIKRYRAVFIFHDATALHRFIADGWEFGGDADAAAKAGDTGANVGAQATSGELNGLEVYTFTDTGIALSATVAATKYYPYDELN